MTYDSLDEFYIGQHVIVKSTDKNTYHRYNLIGEHGVVERISSRFAIGVRLENKVNNASSYGIFWFAYHELELLDEENGGKEMLNTYKNIAIVNLLDDYNKKDYGFALFDTENAEVGSLVVVNPRRKDMRILGTIKEIKTIEEYGKGVTAEVVGVVDTYAYEQRVKEEERQKEIKKQKMAIEKELEAEINKRKSIEYYEEMAKKYSDNPNLMVLVNKLKELGE